MTVFKFQVVRDKDNWSVNLPHQCGDWEITPDGGGFYHSGEPASHADAVAAMETFIAEAQDALRRLIVKHEDEWEDPEDDGEY